MLLRDTRTILIAVVAPLIILPGWILLSNRVERSDERRLEEAEYRYAVTGSEAAWAREQIAQALAWQDPDSDRPAAPFSFVETSVPEPDSALLAGDLHLVVDALSPADFAAVLREELAEAIARAEAAAAEGGGGPDARAAALAQALEDSDFPLGEVRGVRLLYRAQSDFSRNAQERLEERLRRIRAAKRDSVYRAVGFPVPVETVAVVVEEDVASAEKVAGSVLGLVLTPFLLVLMLSGGSIIAADALSGEKERGTLETLLTTAATRSEIVRAKQLAVMVVGLAVAVVNVANLAVYLGLGVLDLPQGLQIGLSVGQTLALLFLFLPLATLVSAALLFLSGVSKSYREYQIYFFPLVIVLLVPSLAPVLPGMELRSVIAMVPVAGIAVAVRDVLLSGVDWLFAGIAFGSTAAAGVLIAGWVENSLSNERLISSAELDEADLIGGAALFPRHVFQWFLGFWVVFFVISLWYGDDLGAKGQVVVNLVGIFFGGSLFLIRRYRLPVRETLALRLPHPAAWLAALVGAPSALLVGVGLAELVNTYVFPVPEELLRAFGESLAEPGFPLWQMVFFLAVMPGVFEEIAFRGVLLHGIRKRWGPWATALAVGVIFGFFHVALFRIVPTAFLGVILAGVVLLTRSIYPAVLWHILNNAMSIVPFQLGWLPEDFTPPSILTPVAVVTLSASLWLMWKTSPREPRLAPRTSPSG
jgi:sodium transport system permease protein